MNNNNKWILLTFVAIPATCSLWAQDWPQWRGPNRDNRVVAFVAPKTWPKDLAQKWKVPVGLGESSPALVGDKIYVFARQGNDEVTLCLDAASGKEVWKDGYPAETVTGGPVKQGHTGTRSSPAVADGKVCTFGVGGVISCLDAASGKIVWRKDTKDRPQFFTSTSPVVIDGRCIVQVGKSGSGTVTAFDLATGDPKWEFATDGAAYGSPALLTVDGVKQIVYPTDKSLVGLNSADGKLLWRYSYSSQYNSVTPIVDGQTIFCSGPNGGTVAIKVEKDGDAFTAKQLWKKTDASHQYSSPVLKNGLLFGLSNRRNFFCMNAQTGDVLWTDSAQRGECGEILDAGSVLLALTSDQNLVVIEPSDKEYKEVARYKVADTPTWAYPVVAGNRVYIKDRDTLALWLIE